MKINLDIISSPLAWLTVRFSTICFSCRKWCSSVQTCAFMYDNSEAETPDDDDIDKLGSYLEVISISGNFWWQEHFDEHLTRETLLRLHYCFAWKHTTLLSSVLVLDIYQTILSKKIASRKTKVDEKRKSLKVNGSCSCIIRPAFLSAITKRTLAISNILFSSTASFPRELGKNR